MEEFSELKDRLCMRVANAECRVVESLRDKGIKRKKSSEYMENLIASRRGVAQPG